jgi:hypothetical protein
VEHTDDMCVVPGIMKNLLSIALAVAAACGGGQKPSSIENRSGSGDSAVALAWKATQAAAEHVDVTLVVGGKDVVIGLLDATADDEPGTPDTCSVTKSDATTSEFRCGATPAFNYYSAKLQGRELVVELVTGFDGGEGNAPEEKHQEVKRIPVAGTALTTAPFAAQESEPNG